MSWSIFRRNVINILSTRNPSYTSDKIARDIAREYDLVIKRGRSLVNGERILSGNLDLMTRSFQTSLKFGTLTTSSDFSLIDNLGRGVRLYWQGARMNPFPTPTIPAIGSIQNLSVVSNTVINSGLWPSYPILPPSKNITGFVDRFILVSTIHLISIKGIIQGISLYPSTPSPIPGNCIIPWSSYVIPLSLPRPIAQTFEQEGESTEPSQGSPQEELISLDQTFVNLDLTSGLSNQALDTLVSSTLPVDLKSNSQIQEEKATMLDWMVTQDSYRCN